MEGTEQKLTWKIKDFFRLFIFFKFLFFFHSMEDVEWLHTALKIVEKSTLNMFLYVAFSENADPELAADLGTWLLNFKAKKSIFKKISKKNFI